MAPILGFYALGHYTTLTTIHFKNRQHVAKISSIRVASALVPLRLFVNTPKHPIFQNFSIALALQQNDVPFPRFHVSDGTYLKTQACMQGPRRTSQTSIEPVSSQFAVRICASSHARCAMQRACIPAVRCSTRDRRVVPVCM